MKLSSMSGYYHFEDCTGYFSVDASFKGTDCPCSTMKFSYFNLGPEPVEDPISAEVTLRSQQVESLRKLIDQYIEYINCNRADNNGRIEFCETFVTHNSVNEQHITFKIDIVCHYNYDNDTRELKVKYQMYYNDNCYIDCELDDNQHIEFFKAIE